MKDHLILDLADGKEIEATLSHPFRPDEKEIHVYASGTTQSLSFSLSEICCILMAEDLEGIIPEEKMNMPDDDDLLEEVETISGKKYHIRLIPGKDYATGFYAALIGQHLPCKLIFFTYEGIIFRDQCSPLCEILRKKGIVPKVDIEKTLKKQEELKSRRVGEILSEQHNINTENIEEVLLKSHKSDKVSPNARIGDILISEGLVTRQQVDEALTNQKSGRKKKIGSLLVESGLVTEEQMLIALSTKFRMRFVNLKKITPDEKAIKALPDDLIHRFQIFPMEYHGDRLIIATSSPTDASIFNLIRFYTKQKIELVVATSDDIATAIKKYYPKEEDIVKKLAKESDDSLVSTEEEEEYDDKVLKESDSQIVRLANRILVDAYEKGASDIHFEPGTGKDPLIVRYRTEGLCSVAHRIPYKYKKPLISRIKIISGLDITEHRRPQSGKIILSVKKMKVEYRVEITPTVGGNEDAVLRILTSAKPIPLTAMDFSSGNLERFKQILSKPYGIILCVGPTGSGKTTTLHSALSTLNTAIRKIWTVEDPVEITQPGLRQVQVHGKIGFSFQEALRSFLRADPDIIMIGEMRDSETAKIAIEASLTGHLVLSTLHTNSAPETITRLIEMGIDPLNFSDALLGILAQRLTLKLCDQCKASYHPSVEEYTELVTTYGENWFELHQMKPYSSKFTLMKKGGCENCNQSGYRGRIAIHEMLIGTEPVKRAIRRQSSAAEIEKLLLKDNMRTLKMDGIQKVFQGLTDLTQVLRVCA